MTNFVRVVVWVLLTALAAGPAFADEFFSAKIGYLSLKPSGEFAGEVNGIGTRIDMEDDLNFDDSQGITAEAALQWGDFRLSAGYLPIKFSGSGTLAQDVVFNGQTYSASTDVSSDVDVRLYEGALAWYLVNVDDLPVRLQFGPELGVKVADADLSLRETAGGTNESVSGVVPIPTVGLRGRIGFSDYLGVVGRVGYMAYQDNSFLDASGELEFSPLPLVGIYAGYRYFSLKIDESDVFVDVQFDGPYAGAFVRF